MANDVTIRVRVREELGGLAQIGTALARLTGGAIVPATAAVAALGVELVGAGAAVGAFGAAVAPQVQEIKKAQQLHLAYANAVDKSGKSSKQAKAALDTYNTAMHQMPKATRDTAAAFEGLQGSFKSWSDSLAGDTMPVLTHALNGLKNIFPLLTPLVKSTSSEMLKLSVGFERFTKTDKFKELVKDFTKFASGALQNVISGVKTVAQVIAGWAGSQGFKDFIAMGSKEGPGIAKMFQNLAEFVGKFISAAGPLAGLQLKALEVLADLLNSIPMPVLKILAPTILGIMAATKLWTIAQLALDVAMDANPIGLVIVAIAALGVAFSIAWKKSETFREIVVTVWQDIELQAADMAKIVIKYFQFMLNVWMTVVGGIVHGAAKAFGWIPGLGPKLQKADNAFQSLKKGIDKSMDGAISKLNSFEQNAIRATQERKLKMRIDDWNNKIDAAKKKLATVPDSKKAALRADIANLQRKVAQAKRDLDRVTGKTVYINAVYTAQGNRQAKEDARRGMATGGIVGAAASGGPRNARTLVGEQGPEIVDLPYGSRVHSAQDTMSMMSGGGGGWGREMRITLVIGDKKLGDVLVDPIRRAVRTRGGNVQAVLGV